MSTLVERREHGILKVGAAQMSFDDQLRLRYTSPPAQETEQTIR